MCIIEVCSDKLDTRLDQKLASRRDVRMQESVSSISKAIVKGLESAFRLAQFFSQNHACRMSPLICRFPAIHEKKGVRHQ